MWSRIANVFRRHVDDDIDAELQSHLDEAHAEGRDAVEASRAFGSRLRAREAVRDAIVMPWFDSLVADLIFGWRQLLKRKTVSTATVLSLALSIGACLAAFRLVDAFFLRPLPIAEAAQWSVLTFENLFDGVISTGDQFDYGSFRQFRKAAHDQAEVLVIGLAIPVYATFDESQHPERTYRQYVSGRMFGAFGLRPTVGRLLTEGDDLTPGAHPYAVLSFDFWSRRFGKDPAVVGRKVLVGRDVLEIVGVAPEGFTGTDPGMFTDLFIPAMMDPAISGNSTAYRTWVRPMPGIGLGGLRERLSAALHAYRAEQVRTWSPERFHERDWFVSAPVSLEPAATGRSTTQRRYQRALTIFAVLVGLVLLIASTNVANLMVAQTAARAREMALRVSLGAGRRRLVQLVLMESLLVALGASGIGLVFAWWAAPFVIKTLNPPGSLSAVRLTLSADWRLTMFAVTLTFGVAVLFGLVPALHASSITPASALKGGNDPRERRRLMNGFVGAAVAFCSYVLFIAGLFTATFERMANQPTGFSAARVLTLRSVSSTGLSAERWYRAAQHIRSLPGVESAALAFTALMAGNARNSLVWANGHTPDGTFRNRTWFLQVSPGWFETMGVELLEGRDLRWDDAAPNVAVVSETFARRYFGSQSPVGRTFETLVHGSNINFDTPAAGSAPTARVAMRIVGLVRDARYEDMRMPVPATAYVPFRTVAGGVERTDNSVATFLIRTRTADPNAVASMVRQEVPKAEPQIRVAEAVAQEDLVQAQMIPERMLATLSVFFATVALVLAGVGLYGVLHYAVVQRRRELGIRIALGAPLTDIAWRVALNAGVMVAIGLTTGCGLGLVSERSIAALLYQTRATDPQMLAAPLITMLGAAVLAALRPVLHAVRLDPAALLRSE
jgi:predicted permease